MNITFKATLREQQGSSASRRLRRAGQIPGIIYGGEQKASPILMDHNELFHLLKKEAFHSTLLSADINGKKETVVLRDTQWHPYKQQVMHLDFQRIDAKQAIHMKVPLHFVNGEISPAVKIGGCLIAHVMTELDIKCLPKHLPEFIEVDLSKLEANQSLHVSHLVLPKNVELAQHTDVDPVVVSATQSRIDAEAEAAAEQVQQEGGATPAA
ncbi:MAG: 50S ribosomal protein L25/general stress protein Ctc [Azoarcus sp.]|jgi:large subunit ribosomal protein L25|nr:50S ribosomal protein L25/general stress protein Ctc [Azoarcus sp.]